MTGPGISYLSVLNVGQKEYTRAVDAWSWPRRLCRRGKHVSVEPDSHGARVLSIRIVRHDW